MISGRQGMVSGCRGTIPRLQGAVPRCRERVPGRRETVPGCRETVTKPPKRMENGQKAAELRQNGVIWQVWLAKHRHHSPSIEKSTRAGLVIFHDGFLFEPSAVAIEVHRPSGIRYRRRCIT